MPGIALCTEGSHVLQPTQPEKATIFQQSMPVPCVHGFLPNATLFRARMWIRVCDFWPAQPQPREAREHKV